jgi:putative transposase
MLCLRIRSEDEEASPPESRTGLQGEDRIYPYLLRGSTINRPNHVWAADISYIPMARGFVYLTAVMDWFTRRILARRLSNTMEASFCIDAVEEALAKHGCPQIFNTDQGSQFTNTEFTSVLINNAISISMDGKGAWRDNVFVERFWRTIKYEEVYPRAYDGVEEARRSIGRHIAFYNARRPHAALDGRTPDQAYSHRCRSARQHNPPPTIHLATRRGGSQCRRR